MRERDVNVKKINFIGKYLAGRFTDNRYDIKISDTSFENIEKAKKTLAENKNLSLVLYGPHFASGDALQLARIYEYIDPKMERTVVAPISFSHSKFSFKDCKNWFMMQVVNSSGVNTIRVVQSRQIDNSNKEKATENNMSVLIKIRHLKKENKPISFLIFPEGHRSEEGKMIEADKGLSAVGSALNPVLYVPVGIDYVGSYKRKSLNFGHEVKLMVGECFLQMERGKAEEIQEIQETLMKRLALCLPPEKRGFYADLAQMPETRK